LAACADTAPAPGAQRAVIGGVFVFVLVTPGVDAVRPHGTFHRRALYPDGAVIWIHWHELGSCRIHAHPVEDGTRVNVVATFTHAHRGVLAAMDPDRRYVKPGRAAQHGEMDVHLAAGRGIEQEVHFRIVAAIGYNRIRRRPGAEPSELPVELASGVSTREDLL